MEASTKEDSRPYIPHPHVLNANRWVTKADSVLDDRVVAMGLMGSLPNNQNAMDQQSANDLSEWFSPSDCCKGDFIFLSPL